MIHEEIRPAARPRRLGRRGLTLLEVTIAAAILAIMLLGVSSAIAHSVRADAISREREAVVRTVQRELDDKVMGISTTGGFDALLTPTPMDEAFDVEIITDGTSKLLSPASGVDFYGSGLVIAPHASGRVGRLTVVAVAEGDYNDGTFDGDHLVQATANARWRGVDGRDHEVIMTVFKVRPLP